MKSHSHVKCQSEEEKEKRLLWKLKNVYLNSCEAHHALCKEESQERTWFFISKMHKKNSTKACEVCHNLINFDLKIFPYDVIHPRS